MSRVDEIRARLAAAPMPSAQAGRQRLGNVLWDAVFVAGSRTGGAPRLIAYVDGEVYADLIAHAPADMAYLLAEVARLRAALEQAAQMKSIIGARKIVQGALADKQS